MFVRLLGVLCAALLIVTTSVRGEADSQSGPTFPRIANVYGVALTPDGARVAGKDCTLEEVARCDLLIGVRWSRGGATADDDFKRQLAAVKQINPHLMGLHFACSAPYTHIAPNEQMLSERQPGQVLPWLLQADGQTITGWPGTTMVNLAVPGVVEWLAHQTVPPVRQRGYDGIFIDCMGPRFDHWACEIATGKQYTVDANADGQEDETDKLDEIWAQAKTNLARRTRELLGDEPIFMANQAGPSTFEQLNGIYLEDYVDYVLDGSLVWEDALDKYLHWTQTPRKPNVTVLGCSSGVEPPFEAFRLSPEEQATYLDRGKPQLARMRFGLATTLMGDGYYSFDLNTRWRGQLWWYPEYDAPLGYPTGPCRPAANGTWQRSFDGGLVVVNPSHWDVALEFDVAHHDVSSTRVAQRFVLPRQDGRIYLPVDADQPLGDVAEAKNQLTWTGPAGIVERDGSLVIRNGRGLAVLLNESGEIESICDNGRELISGVRPVIVKDEKWKNFAYTQVQHQADDAGVLVFTGKRSEQDQTLEFTETVSVEQDRVTVRYDWCATTDVQLQAFRQAVYLPPSVFGGAEFCWEDGQLTLPEQAAESPSLAKGITTATVTCGEGQSMTVHSSQPAHLVDDRYYNGRGYLLASYPVGGKIAAGREWSYSIEFKMDKL